MARDTSVGAKAGWRAKRWMAAAIAAGSVLAGCGGGFVFGHFDFVDDDFEVDAVFVFRMRGQIGSQDFQVATHSAEFVRLARAELQRPTAERRLVVNGRVARGTGGFNAPWSWHLDDAFLAESQPAACDGLPSQVEADPDGWIARVGRFCPSAAFVVAEL